MVNGVLADVNIEAHVDYLMALAQAAPWTDVWQELSLAYLRFADVGLEHDAPDVDIWECCQNGEYLLITSNRNSDGPDSLEATIRNRNADGSLPVLTIADPERLRRSRDYADEVVERFLTTLLDIETLRGTGRLYLP